MKADETIYHFAQASPENSDESITDLLRRVADSIDKLQGARINSLMLQHEEDGTNPHILVLYSYPNHIKPSEDELRSTMRTLTVQKGDAGELFAAIATKLEKLKDVDVYGLALDDYFDDDANNQYRLTAYYD